MQMLDTNALQSVYLMKNAYPFTASLKALAALNFGTVVAGTSIDSPVRGFRAVRAFRACGMNDPNPASETSSPFATVSTIVSRTVATTFSDSTFVPPSTSCTFSASACLFIVGFLILKRLISLFTLYTNVL